MISSLFESTIFALFVIIAIGFIVGRINFKGINLDVSAVIFVALFFGHMGVEIPAALGNFGMVLFIFSIGIQAGPGFFSTFKSKGKTMAVLALVLVFTAAVVALGTGYFFGFTPDQAAGLLTGALTSTPGLATAKEVAGDSAAIAYSIAYPFGVIGVILFVKLLPKFLKLNIKKEEDKLKELDKATYPKVEASAFKVTNEIIVGRSIKDLAVRAFTGAVISRVIRKDRSFIPHANDTLEVGDLVKAVGSEDSLVKLTEMLGERLEGDLPFSDDIVLSTALLTNKPLVGKPLMSLNLQQNFGCTITRVRRSGLDLAPDPSLKLQFGDKLSIVGNKDQLKEVFSLVGNQRSQISDTDFFPIALGIVIGVIVGNIAISFDSFSFSFGLTGGVLLTALLLSAIGKTGNVIWSMTPSANNLLRSLGLLLFLANVGCSAGATLVDTFLNSGWSLFIAGALITLIPMIVATVVARVCYKMNLVELLGVLTGGMTSTPGLAAADSMCSGSAASVAYATVYPVAMVFLIILTKVVASLV